MHWSGLQEGAQVTLLVWQKGAEVTILSGLFRTHLKRSLQKAEAITNEQVVAAVHLCVIRLHVVRNR